MSDGIHLNHETVNEAVNEMMTANQQMLAAMDDLVQELTPLAQTFEGETKNAWQEVQRTIDAQHQRMTEAFGNASGVLTSMHETLTTADHRGAAFLN